MKMQIGDIMAIGFDKWPSAAIGQYYITNYAVSVVSTKKGGHSDRPEI